MTSLAELAPRWVTIAGRRIGVSFLCPCARCTAEPCRDDGQRIAVRFANPADGGAPFGDEPLWRREGEAFETLSLSPSVDMSKHGHWHGLVTAGRVE